MTTCTREDFAYSHTWGKRGKSTLFLQNPFDLRYAPLLGPSKPVKARYDPGGVFDQGKGPFALGESPVSEGTAGLFNLLIIC